MKETTAFIVIMLFVSGCVTSQPSPAFKMLYSGSHVVYNGDYSLHTAHEDGEIAVLLAKGNRNIFHSTKFPNGKEETDIFLKDRSGNTSITFVDEDGDGIIDFLSFDVLDKTDKTSVKHFRDIDADGQWDIMLDHANKKRYLWLQSQWLEWPKQDYVLKNNQKYRVFKKDNKWHLGNKMTP